MKFETPIPAGKPEIDSGSNELETLSANHQKEKELQAGVEGRRDYLARIFAATLAFYGVTDEAEMLILRDAGASAFAAESLTLTESVSTGQVRLSSGEVIVVPKPGDLFERVTVYTPTDKDPDRLILLFSQIHKLSEDQLKGIDPSQYQSSLDRALDSQKRIYSGLKQMIEENSISAVCSEGTTSWDSVYENMEWYGNNKMATSSIVAHYLPGSDLHRAIMERDQLFESDFTIEKLDKLEAQIEPVLQSYAAQYKYLMGADMLLTTEGELTPCPGEGAEAHINSNQVDYLLNKPSETWTEEERRLFKKLMFEDREDAALETVLTNMPDKAIALTYGAGHDFTNNLDKWNATHPDEQVGIVEMRAPFH